MAERDSTTPLLPGASNPLHRQNRPSPYSRFGQDSSTEHTAVADANLGAATSAVLISTRRRLGFFDGVALVLGLQVGSGIFASPALVLRNTESEALALVVWIAAGLLAWACAACYIELGVQMPYNGGPLEYLSYCYGPLFGFLGSWACIFFAKPCSAAIISRFTADYICDVIKLDTGVTEAHRTWLTVAIIVSIGFINSIDSKASTATTKALLFCKLAGVALVLLVGYTHIFVHGSSLPSFYSPGRSASGHASYADAVTAAMWAYSGWETLGFVGGELKNPERNTARVITVSMILVIVFSVLANMAYFGTLSYEEIVNSTSIGLTFSRKFLGDVGNILYMVMICLSNLGSLNIKTFTASRLTLATAEKGYLPACLKTIGYDDSDALDDNNHTTGIRKRWEFWKHPLKLGDGTVPVSSVAFNSILAVFYVLTGSFSSLVAFMGNSSPDQLQNIKSLIAQTLGIVEYSVVFITLLGLVRLRLRPARGRQETCPATLQVPLTVVFFATAVTMAIVLLSVCRHVRAGVGFIAFSVASAGIYKAWVRV